MWVVHPALSANLNAGKSIPCSDVHFSNCTIQPLRTFDNYSTDFGGVIITHLMGLGVTLLIISVVVFYALLLWGEPIRLAEKWLLRAAASRKTERIVR
jgi:hypothetical protein